MAQKIKTMLAEANAEIETIPAAAAMELLNDENVCFIDIRDSAELERDGKIPGAIHVPRGSDPETYRARLEAAMNAIAAEADRHCGHAPIEPASTS